MKNKLKKIIYNLNYKGLMKNYILLESNPDYSDNTKGIFDELIKRNLNKKIKIIWFIYSNKNFNDIKIKNVKFINVNKNGILNKIKVKYYLYFSKYIIDSNFIIEKRNINQFRIHLTHGTPIKLAKEYCGMVGKLDYLIQISDYFTKIHKDLFNVKESQLLSLGFPRNDMLLNDNGPKFDIIEKNKNKKVVLWFPTYRNHKNKKNKLNRTFKYGVPCINNAKELKDLNKYLKNNNILLLIKLHPVENIEGIKKLKLSNIVLLDETIFEKNHTNLYQLMHYCDALITDYSSVYYDFLLLDRPLGLAISDIEEYKKQVDLIFDNLEENLAGEFLYTYNDLMNFFKNIIEEKDVSKKNRQQALKKFHKYHDNKSASRIVDVLERKIRDQI